MQKWQKTHTIKSSCISSVKCDGRIEWHHSLIFGGRQVQAKFAILPACHYHHAHVATYNENFVYIALQRATEAEIRSISKAIDYFKVKERLSKIYG